MQHKYGTDGWGRKRARVLAGGGGILIGLLLLPVALLAQAAGDLDSTFGSGGKVTTDIVGTVFAVALQPDGKIVVAGTIIDFSDSTSNGDFGLARYLSDGTPDTTFGGSGHVRTDLGSFESAKAVLLQPDGKIIAVGSAEDPSDPPHGVPTGIAIARYLSNGTLDTTFGGGDGFVIGGIGGASAAVLQPDGKILAAGGETLARYLPNGTLDTTFGGGGVVTTNFGGFSAFSVALQADGKIIVAGQAQANSVGDEDFAMARYNSNGTLDTTFSGGHVATGFGQTQDRATGIAVQPDGKIVLAGNSDDGSLHRGFGLARYSSNGTLDASFSGDGRMTTDFGPNTAAALNAVELQSDGKLVVAGFVTDLSTGDRQFALARYQSDGTLDGTFGGDGRVTTNIGDGDNDSAFALALQSDGKIVAAGFAEDLANLATFALVRYHGLSSGEGQTVNGLVTLGAVRTSFNSAAVPSGPAGTLTIHAGFKNTSTRSIHSPFFRVAQLTGGNLLLNADDAPGGVGSKLTPNVGADDTLAVGESFTVDFIVGLQTRRPFTFLVDLVEIPIP